MSIPPSRDLRLLAGAAGLSALGDFMAIFPLVLHVQQRTGSALAVSALIFALWGPVVLAAGVAGAIVDRFENRRILIGVSLVQAASVAAMLVGLDSLWALLPLMTVLGLTVAISQPAEFALVPAVAGPGTDAARANGLMETVRSLGFTAGPLVGGALAAGRNPPRTPPSRSAHVTDSPSSPASATSRSRSAAPSPRSRCSPCPRPQSRSSSPACSVAAASPTGCC